MAQSQYMEWNVFEYFKSIEVEFLKYKRKQLITIVPILL